MSGGFNGGGNGGDGIAGWGGGPGGGGATHIATVSGLLFTLEENKSSVLIVSGGGGGSSNWLAGGVGGGFEGKNTGGKEVNQKKFQNIAGGTQTSGYKFGLGENAVNKTRHHDTGAEGAGGGGGGWYGGKALEVEGNNTAIGGGGGSGYVGNPLLTDKHMACYNCKTSSEESTKTISVDCTSKKPIADCAKKGNGYARITYLGDSDS